MHRLTALSILAVCALAGCASSGGDRPTRSRGFAAQANGICRDAARAGRERIVADAPLPQRLGTALEVWDGAVRRLRSLSAAPDDRDRFASFVGAAARVSGDVRRIRQEAPPEEKAIRPASLQSLQRDAADLRDATASLRLGVCRNVAAGAVDALLAPAYLRGLRPLLRHIGSGGDAAYFTALARRPSAAAAPVMRRLGGTASVLQGDLRDLAPPVSVVGHHEALDDKLARLSQAALDVGYEVKGRNLAAARKAAHRAARLLVSVRRAAARLRAAAQAAAGGRPTG